MKPTPMTAYTTANSARVLPTPAAPKPALYAARVAELMALGLTAVQAMHRIERGDRHRALAPNSQAGNQGSQRKPRPMSNQRKVALASLTDEFTDAIPGIAAKLEISNTAARSLLRAMVSDEKGRVQENQRADYVEAVMNPTQLHDGRVFPSISAAARALDIDHTTLIYHLDTHGHTGKAGKQCRKCEVNGVEYPSITAACKATGLTRDKINWMRGYRKPKK